MDDQHFKLLASLIIDNQVVPFLGAGVNLCGRPAGQAYDPDRNLPLGKELSKYFAEKYDYPANKEEPRPDLLRVSQYVYAMHGAGVLYEDLHRLFKVLYPITRVHAYLARLPRLIRARVWGDEEHTHFGPRRSQGAACAWSPPRRRRSCRSGAGRRKSGTRFPAKPRNRRASTPAMQRSQQ